MGASFRRNAAAKACLVFMDGVYTERKWEKQDHCYHDVLTNSSILVSGRNISIGLKGKQDISKVKTLEDGTVECSIVSLNYQVFYEGKELPTDRYKPRINYTYREFDDGSGYDYHVNIAD